MTPAERMLWERLRARQFLGLKFRRQFPIQGYIADFCSYEEKLIVEIDGEVHNQPNQVARDQNRDAYLQSLGYKILRFSNQDVLDNTPSVLHAIARALNLTFRLDQEKRD